MMMQEQLDLLNQSIKTLNNVNNQILGSIDDKISKKLKDERNIIITNINTQCKNIRLKITKEEHEQFNNLITKYLKMQKNYHDTERNIFATQIVMRNPSISMETANNMILEGCPTDNILCVLNGMEMYDYVKQRHAQILKLEKSIQEVHELFVGTYAIIEQQGETVDRIATKTKSAKLNCSIAKTDLKTAYKYTK